jgi:hypothetical protein
MIGEWMLILILVGRDGPGVEVVPMNTEAACNTVVNAFSKNPESMIAAICIYDPIPVKGEPT